MLCFALRWETSMDMKNIPFGTTIWSQIIPTEHQGESGVAHWRTQQFDTIRVRMVEYSPGYLADHWCSKGHVIYCIEGSMITALEDGSQHLLSVGMTYHVGDNCEAHRSSSAGGCRLLIVD